MRIGPILAAIPVICLGACSTELTDRRMMGLSGSADFIGPVETVAERQFGGVIRQAYDFSCGSAALATLLRYHYGERIDEADAFRGMWAAGDREQIRRVGFSLLDMKRYLQEKGLPANGFSVSLDEVINGGTPGIALINVKGYKHFVVVKGATDQQVLVGDPSVGLKIMPAADFGKVWNGVYFIIQPGTRKGRFNVASHWAGYTRAPIGSAFSQPLSQQALALTTPFYRDF